MVRCPVLAAAEGQPASRISRPISGLVSGRAEAKLPRFPIRRWLTALDPGLVLPSLTVASVWSTTPQRPVKASG